MQLRLSDYEVVENIVKQACKWCSLPFAGMLAEGLRDSLRDELLRLAQTVLIPEPPARDGWIVYALRPRVWRYINHTRRAWGHPLVEHSVMCSCGDQAMDVATVYSTAARVLNKREHEVFMLRHPVGEEGCSFSTIASILHYPSHPAAQRKYYTAIDKLRSTLG